MNGGAGGLEPGDALLPQDFDLGRHALDAVFLRHPDAKTFNPLCQGGLIIGDGRVDAGGVPGVMTGHGFQHDGGVAHRFGDGSGLIERGGERDNAPPRAAAVGRLDADSAGERGGLADRTAGVGRGGGKAEAARNGCRRSARRSARYELVGAGLAVLAEPPPRVGHGAERAGLVRGPHCEFVVVELAEHDGPGVPKVGADGGFIGRLEVVEDLGAGGSADAFGAEQVLVAERQTFERAGLTRCQALVALLGLGERMIGRHQHVGVEGGVPGVDGR